MTRRKPAPDPLATARRAADDDDADGFLALTAALAPVDLHTLVFRELRDAWPLWILAPRIRGFADADLRLFLRSAVAVAPDHSAVHELLAECLARAHAGNAPLWANHLGHMAYELVGDRNFDAAITLYAAAITLPCEVDLSLYCNALWVLQHDNTGRPVDPVLNDRFLAACLPWAPKNPAIFYNAACLTYEMGDIDGTLAHLEACLAHGFKNPAQVQREPLFAPLRHSDPRFDALFTAHAARKKPPRKTTARKQTTRRSRRDSD
ncbi:MAG: hypothetical protein JNL82_41375 [Myxococcales bacterium]|nr:hypothetical protein [Myxococcales bacterium]